MESSTKNSNPAGQQAMSADSDEPSLIQYRSKRRCVVEREKKKKKEWWEEEDVLSDEEDLGDIDSDGSDSPRRPKQRKKMVFPTALLPPPNRIFMFSTELANRAADAVAQGRAPSIVAYHMAQPQNQRYLKIQRKTADFTMSRPSGGHPYRYGGFPAHMANMDMFGGGRPAAPPMDMGQRFNSMQYQQYLKQQQPLESRNALGVEELQQMLFGPPNGTKGMFSPAGMPSGVDNPGGARPPFTGYPGHMPAGFGQQQMMNMRFAAPHQNFPSQQMVAQQGSAQRQPHLDVLRQSQVDELPPQTLQHDEQKGQRQQQPEGQRGSTPDQDQSQPGSTDRTQPPSQAPPSNQQTSTPQLPALSPGSSLSSSSPLGSTIRSPPPYHAARPNELNTLPGASSMGVPSPTNTNSPQTPHAPLTPRLSTSLASPTDGQRSPFSPGVPTSAYMTQQNIRDPGMKAARRSPNLEKPDLQADKGIPSGYGVPGDSRIPGYAGQNVLPQRPNSLSVVGNASSLGPPPNRSPFLESVASPMRMPSNHSLMGNAVSSHPSKFSVESLTAPNSKEQRFYHPSLAMQPSNPYAAYAQQPGLYYAGNKFLPGMLGQGQYQFPPHLQTAPQQFFPSNMPPQMYPPHGSFPIHHAGNRDGSM